MTIETGDSNGSDPSKFGRLERVPVREGWKDEAAEFTPWLAEHLDRLGEAIGLALEHRRSEHPVGRYFLDILAEDARARVVIIENQLTSSDHGHLGQLLTYCAGTDARVVIWIAPTFNQEHIAALEWLNQNTNSDVAFYAVELQLLRIGASQLAPDFRPVVRPNDLTKIARSATAEAVDWNWERYASELNVPDTRLAVAKRLVEAISLAIEQRQLPWQPKFNKGYVAFQRPGGYNALLVDMIFARPVRLIAKLPAGPLSSGLENPFPLPDRWSDRYGEWEWTITSMDDVPDVGLLMDRLQHVTETESSSLEMAGDE